MPIIFARWILGICLRFGNNLSKMCSFAEFNRSKLDICTNLQKKNCIGEQIFIGEWSFYIIPTISLRWILGICHRFGNNLTKMCSYAEFNRPKLDIYTDLQKKALHWRANPFWGTGATKLYPPYTRDGF